VNFPKKQLRLSYDPQKTTLFELVEFLASIGYAPTLSMNALAVVPKKQNRRLLYQLGVAGFAFGNIMFLSLPEYFTANEFWLDRYKYVFRWLIFFFSLPVLFFAGWDYLKGAYLSIKSKWIIIDVPVALGMIALFIRSFLALLFDWGSGYFDSLSILINRWKEK
jgi:Cu+-exporting ATPase